MLFANKQFASRFRLKPMYMRGMFTWYVPNYLLSGELGTKLIFALIKKNSQQHLDKAKLLRIMDCMAVTMRQLADRFDVAPSTISRALSGRSGTSENLSREIRQAAKQMGYRPQPYRRKVNKTVGLITASDQTSHGGPIDPYQLDLMSNVMDVVGAADWHLHSEKIGFGSDKLPRLVSENRVDGVILCQHPSEALCKKIKEMGIPAIVLDDTPKRTGLPCVIADVGPATAKAVEDLAAMGHKNIAMVTTPKRYPTVYRRVDGFLQGLSNAGLDYANPNIVSVGYSTLQQGQTATRQLLYSGSAAPKPVNYNEAGRAGVSPANISGSAFEAGITGETLVPPTSGHPTAIIYATDRLAIGGMLEINSAGLSVPDDISIVGHDNTLLGQGCNPALTSIDMNMKNYVTAAFDELQNIIAGDISDKREYSPDSIEIPCNTIWRNSCGPVNSIRSINENIANIKDSQNKSHKFHNPSSAVALAEDELT